MANGHQRAGGGAPRPPRRGPARAYVPTSKGPEAFAQVETSVLRDPDLPATARLLYALLRSYGWQQTTARPAVPTLARDLGISDRQTRTLLRKLEAARLIEIRRRPGRPSLYVFTDPDGERPTPETDFRGNRNSGSGPPLKSVSADEDAGHGDSHTNTPAPPEGGEGGVRGKRDPWAWWYE